MRTVEFDRNQFTANHGIVLSAHPFQCQSYHAGDVIVSLDAQVSGGIGPQRSVSSMIIKSQGA